MDLCLSKTLPLRSETTSHFLKSKDHTGTSDGTTSLFLDSLNAAVLPTDCWWQILVIYIYMKLLKTKINLILSNRGWLYKVHSLISRVQIRGTSHCIVHCYGSPDSPLDGPAVVQLQHSDNHERDHAIVKKHGRKEPQSLTGKLSDGLPNPRELADGIETVRSHVTAQDFVLVPHPLVERAVVFGCEHAQTQ